jgi:hypothetical protein
VGIAKALFVGTTASIAGAVTLSGGTANGVAYLDGSKVVTSGSALTFDGSSTLTMGTNTVVKNSSGFNIFRADTDLYLDAKQGGISGDILFRQASAEQMRLTSTGLGIGTSSPSKKLEVANSDALIYGLTVGRGNGAVASATVLGNGALAAVNTGIFNTAIGSSALAANTSGYANTALGSRTLVSNTTGQLNTAVGDLALYANTTGNYNTGVGDTALQNNTTASNNTAVGYQAGYSISGSQYNTATGSGALYSHTTGNGANAAFGYNAFRLTTTAESGVAIGTNAAYSNTTGSYNTAVGKDSLYSNTTASNNTAVGYQAGLNITTGANNACFGYVAGTDAVRNITTNSNEIVMGNNSHTAAYIKVAWTVTSDARDKTSFATVPHGLAFVNLLTPTAYQFRVSREDETAIGPVRYGFKAQDILAAEGILPVIIDNSDPENLKYNQDSMIAVLVKAIQELKAEFDAYKSTHP